MLAAHPADPQCRSLPSRRIGQGGVHAHRDRGVFTMNSPRSASLASTFQEVFTAIVRVRFRLQRVQDSPAFRREIRHSLQHAMQQARSLGYTNESVQTAVFATVAFLDESVLNLQDTVFADWAGRPLQEELFGGHLA